MSLQWFDAGLRRVIDVTAAACGLIILSPLLATIALSVKLCDRGPVFHVALRVGRQSRTIGVYKFRSMIVGADRKGPGVTINADRRITSVGHWLRRTKLDELPQLFNVLKGDMALVGPRPEDQRYVDFYTPEQRLILDYRPGITSPASLRFRNEEQLLAGADWEQHYIRQIMPAKLAIDLAYLSRRNVISDLVLIAQTTLAIFAGRAKETTRSSVTQPGKLRQRGLEDRAA